MRRFGKEQATLSMKRISVLHEVRRYGHPREMEHHGHINARCRLVDPESLRVIREIAVGCRIQLQSEEAEFMPLPQDIFTGSAPQGIYVAETYEPVWRPSDERGDLLWGRPHVREDHCLVDTPLVEVSDKLLLND